MTSSNRHWPSMFKSKPSNTCLSVPGCDERSPEPKSRWNPKPEQIRILETIFNSGMVNPPRDEIRKIRAQLQVYGQVGDANVFYWFQNRKSRSKHKLRLLQNSTKQQRNSQQQQQRRETDQTPPVTTSTSSLTIPSPSSSSSSEKSYPECSKMTFYLSSQAVFQVPNSATGYVNQTYFQQHNELMLEPFSFPVQHGPFTQGFSFPDLSNEVQVQDNTVGPCEKDLEYQNMKMQSSLSYTVSSPTPVIYSNGLAPLPLPNTYTKTDIVSSSVNQVNKGSGESRSTVFINGIACDVGVGPFNVREAFGDDFVLIHSTGHPVLSSEWGVSLQHGASYYLVPFSMSEHI